MSHKVIYSFDGKKPIQIKIENGFIDSMDLRFEDYPKSTTSERNFITILLQINAPPFYGKFPNSNRYIYFNGDYLTIKLSKPKGIKLPQKDRFGNSWWDYAAAYKGNEIIKQPLKSRIYETFYL